MEYLPFTHSNFKTKLDKPGKHIGGMTAPSSVGSIFSWTGVAFMTAHHLSAWARTETHGTCEGPLCISVPPGELPHRLFMFVEVPSSRNNAGIYPKGSVELCSFY